MQHTNQLSGRLALMQTAVDEIMAASRARFGHGQWFMQEGDGGGSNDAAAADAGATSGDGEPASDDGADQLGDAGKQALDRMKNDRNEAQKRAKAAEAELEKLRTASKSEQEKALDAARKEGQSEALATANARLVRSEVRVAAAAAKFRDAGDAVAQLGSKLGEITVDDDGEVDGAAVKKLIADLAKAKPYLVDGGSSASDAGIGAVGDRSTPDPGPGRARLASAYGASKS